MKNGVFATIKEDGIGELLDSLKQAGFSGRRVSVLIPRAHEPEDLSLVQDVEQGVVSGGIVGIIAAELGTIGVLALAGVGSVLVAGPLLLSLAGAAVAGAAVGGVIGGLAAGTGDLARLIGISKPIVDYCEAELRKGRGLVVVDCESEEAERQARRILTDAGAAKVQSTQQAKEAAG